MRQTTKLLVVGLAMLTFDRALADPKNAPVQRSTGIADVPFTASLRIDLQPKLEVGARSLIPGETVNAGDRFTLTSWTDEAVYLYIVGYEPTGWSKLLFPRSKDTIVQKGEQIRLPDSGNPYKLNNESGEVTLYVYASRKPLDSQACDVLRLPCPLWRQDGSRGGGSDTKEPPPPPPRPAGTSGKDRPSPFINNAKEHYVSAKSDDKGVAVLRFTFKHAP